jgi:hypothetical protein
VKTDLTRSREGAKGEDHPHSDNQSDRRIIDAAARRAGETFFKAGPRHEELICGHLRHLRMNGVSPPNRQDSQHSR